MTKNRNIVIKDMSMTATEDFRILGKYRFRSGPRANKYNGQRDAFSKGQSYSFVQTSGRHQLL